MKCLVLGNTGLVGSALTARLIELGHEVTADRRDILDREHLGDGGPFEIVFNCAALVGSKACTNDPERAIEVNIEGVLNIIDTFPDAWTKIIHSSTVAVDQPTVYGITKKIAERLFAKVFGSVELRYEHIQTPEYLNEVVEMNLKAAGLCLSE